MYQYSMEKTSCPFHIVQIQSKICHLLKLRHIQARLENDITWFYGLEPSCTSTTTKSILAQFWRISEFVARHVVQ